MNSLDRAFIRAYARDLDADSLTAAAASRTAAATTQPRRRTARPAQAAPASEPLVEVTYADGSWYRIEQPSAAEPAARPPAPHSRHPNRAEPQPDEIAQRSESRPNPPPLGGDVDLMARFRPPLFRDVALRQTAEPAVAPQCEPAAPVTGRSAGSFDASAPTLDYTLAPPSPPLAPRVTLNELPGSESPPPRSTPRATSKRETPAAEPASEWAVEIPPEELRAYAEQCKQQRSVLLDLDGAASLDSPEESHVMLVDLPLEMLESEAQRQLKRLQDDELARQREAMLAALMQPEVIVGDGVAEPQWLYGSEAGEACSIDELPADEDILTGSHDGGEPPAAKQNGAAATLTPADVLNSKLLGPLAPPMPEPAASEQAGKPDEIEQPATPVAESQQPHQPAADPPAKAAQPAPFASAWEVDRIAWPAISDQLLDDAREQFQAAIARLKTGKTGRMVVVSGRQRGEGRTTLAICLARSAAAAGLRVALIDSDFAAPSLASNLSLETMSGWDHVLDDGSPLSESAIASIDDRLTIVPLEKQVTAAALSRHADRLRADLSHLAESFDLVLLDAGPTAELLEAADWLPAMSSRPLLLLAHDMRTASLLEVEQSVEQAQAAGWQVLGVAQTFAPAA